RAVQRPAGAAPPDGHGWERGRGSALSRLAAAALPAPDDPAGRPAAARRGGPVGRAVDRALLVPRGPPGWAQLRAAAGEGERSRGAAQRWLLRLWPRDRRHRPAAAPARRRVPDDARPALNATNSGLARSGIGGLSYGTPRRRRPRVLASHGTRARDPRA